MQEGAFVISGDDVVAGKKAIFDGLEKQGFETEIHYVLPGVDLSEEALENFRAGAWLVVEEGHDPLDVMITLFALGFLLGNDFGRESALKQPDSDRVPA